NAFAMVTALPSIQRDLGASLETLEWTMSAYSLTAAGFIITATALGDRLGRARVFTTGLALFTLASAMCALAPGPAILILGRALQGLGAAIIVPLGLTILTGGFPAERRGAVVGFWGGVAGLAGASGPLIGGAIAQGLDWHWIFWVNVPFGLFAMTVSARRLHESRGPARRLDIPGLLLVSSAATCVVYAMAHVTEVGWNNQEGNCAVCVGVLSLI